MRLARSIDRFAGAAWFLALALVVAGPLLGSGRLLLLDFPSGPRFPALPEPLGSRSEVASTDPLVALHALLGAIHPLVPDKLFLLAPVFLGGLGVYRLARSGFVTGVLPAIYGGTVFAVNPFVADRYFSGHLYVLLAYSLLPWAFGAALAAARQPRVRAAVPLGLWLAGLTAVSIHFAGIYVLLAGAVMLVAQGRLRTRLACLGGTVALGALLSSFWLLPALFLASEGSSGEAELEAYASRPHGLRALPALAAMHGFWRDEFQRPAEALPLLYVFLLPIIALAVLGAAASFGSAHRGRFAAALSSAAALGLLLAASTSLEASRSAARWTISLLPALSVYREPQKLLVLTVLAYALFGVLGLEAIARKHTSVRPSRLMWAASLGATAAVLVYGHSMLWGLSGQAQLSRYPASWTAAEQAMEGRGPGRLLVLPGHPYAVWSFTGGRIVANPARSFFSRDVLTRGGSGFDAPGAQWREVEEGLAQARSTHRLGKLLAPLGVRFIAWLRESDWWEYRLLERQQDLLPLYRSGRISVFENAAWRPGPRFEPSPVSPPTATLLGYAFSFLTLVGCLHLLRRRRTRGGQAVQLCPISDQPGRRALTVRNAACRGSQRPTRAGSG